MGIELAKAYITVMVDGKPAQTSLANVKRDFFNMGRDVQAFAMNIKGKLTNLFMGAVTYMGLRSLNAAVRESIALWGVQEKAEARAAAVIKATGGAAGFTAAQMKSMASEIQSTTTYGDEMVLGGMAKLATFRHVMGDEFKRAMKLSTDLAAVGLGSVESSAMQLGKALEDPSVGLSMLRRVGVSFNQQQIKTIKLLQAEGRLREAQVVMLAEVEKQVGGVAEAMAKTDTGKVEQLSNAIGDVKEQIGKGLMPVMVMFKEATLKTWELIGVGAGVITPIITALGSYDSSIQRVKKSMDEAAVDLRKYYEGVERAGTVMQNAGDRQKYFADSMGDVRKKLAELREESAKVSEQIKTESGGVLKAILHAMGAYGPISGEEARAWEKSAGIQKQMAVAEGAYNKQRQEHFRAHLEQNAKTKKDLEDYKTTMQANVDWTKALIEQQSDPKVREELEKRLTYWEGMRDVADQMYENLASKTAEANDEADALIEKYKKIAKGKKEGETEGDAKLRELREKGVSRAKLDQLRTAMDLAEYQERQVKAAKEKEEADKKAAAEYEKDRKTAADMIERYKEQAATIGMSSTEAERYRLSRMKLLPAERELAELALRQLEAAEKRNELLQESRQIMEGIKTPEEKLDERLKKLSEMFAQGMITRAAMESEAAKAFAAAKKKEGIIESGTYGIAGLGKSIQASLLKERDEVPGLLQEQLNALNKLVALAEVRSVPTEKGPGGYSRFSGTSQPFNARAGAVLGLGLGGEIGNVQRIKGMETAPVPPGPLPGAFGTPSNMFGPGPQFPGASRSATAEAGWRKGESLIGGPGGTNETLGQILSAVKENNKPQPAILN